MDTWPKRHRISVDDYYRMAEVGPLGPDERVELIDGEIIDMAPIGNGRASVVDRLAPLPASTRCSPSQSATRRCGTTAT